MLFNIIKWAHAPIKLCLGVKTSERKKLSFHAQSAWLAAGLASSLAAAMASTQALQTSSYDGDRKNGRMEGHGKYTFPSGTIYTGQLLDGEFHGQGVLEYPGEYPGPTAFTLPWASPGPTFFHPSSLVLALRP